MVEWGINVWMDGRIDNWMEDRWLYGGIDSWMDVFWSSQLFPGTGI